MTLVWCEMAITWKWLNNVEFTSHWIVECLTMTWHEIEKVFEDELKMTCQSIDKKEVYKRLYKYLEKTWI